MNIINEKIVNDTRIKLIRVSKREYVVVVTTYSPGSYDWFISREMNLTEAHARFDLEMGAAG